MKLFKRAIRKIAPLAASALMLGGSVGFAAAADLADFPQPYVDSAGVADVAIIIGADAAAEDTIAATDIQSALVVPVSSGGTTTVSGGESKDIPVGYNLNDNTYGWSSSLSDSDVPSLLDIDDLHIAINDVSDDYSIHEEIVFGAGLAVRTGLNITSPHQKYKDRVFLQAKSGSIVYKYVFDETVKKGNYLSNSTTDDPVEMTILGRDVEITSADKTAGDDLTALVGDKFTLRNGESKTVGSNTVTLTEVGSDGSIVVSVDGESEIIGSGNTKTINKVRVKNHARVYTNDESGRAATLIAGAQTSKNYANGEAFIGQDEDDPDWVWKLGNLHGADDSGKPKINISLDQTWTNEDEVIYEGESITLPNGYITIAFDSLTDGVWQEYRIYGDSIELYNSTGGNKQGSGVINAGEESNDTAQNVLVIESTGGKNTGFKLPATSAANPLATSCAGKETDVLYVYGYQFKVPSNFTLFWKDHDDSGKAKFCARAIHSETPQRITIQSEDSTFNMDLTNVTATSAHATNSQLRITIGAGEQQYLNLTINTTISGAGFEYGFGSKDGEAVDTDVKVIGSMGGGAKNIGTWKENTLTVDGVLIYNPNTYGDGNEFYFGIPQDENTDFRANIHVYGAAGGSSTAGGSSFTKSPSATFFDSQISTVNDRHIITIGGSAANRVSAEVLGLSFPTYGSDQAWQDATGVTGEGQALVKVFDSPYAASKTAMLVAGWRGIDSQRAGNALYRGVPALSGQEALLSTVTSTVTVT